MADLNQLPIPNAAKQDRKAFELLRVWIADGDQHVSLSSGIWDDPAAWGMMLADLAGHIANAYEQSSGADRAEVLERMKDALDAEWASPTDELAGEITE